MNFDLTLIFGAAAQVSALIPNVIALYQDIAADKQLDDEENLKKIVEFINGYVPLLDKYVAPGEVVLLVVGVLGMLHQGDSSALYERVQEVMADGES